jgi:transposase, IS5 family
MAQNTVQYQRGLVKNTAQIVTLFALSNLWMARRSLMGAAG